MAKKDKSAPENDVKQTALGALAGDAQAATADAAPKAEKAPAAPKTRGPRGTTEAAVIKVLSAANPKRVGSKANAVFALYANGQTIAELFTAAKDLEAAGIGADYVTANMVYDAKHGFISIDGYDPGEIVTVKARAPKAEKAPKTPRAKKEKAPVDTTLAENKAALEDETKTETME